ncbi:tetratricopeptide repeat protein [Mariniblastus fucicola]|uniref:Tetratricopeptide repeat protein n=1 Tax=Mariniblastus fucicola TaxID=980251 RepID=A0A5B9PDW3_9BACT|nr:hypothetical protein [Mariniblastus fucicola]QEG24598.1 hypothetical protein MFFC18_45190 [Mariniblastus fucicola]
MNATIRVVVGLVVLLSAPFADAQESVFDDREQNLVGGLRDRSLFELAELHCLKVLDRQNLTPTDFASLAVERIRVRTSQARVADDRELHWQQVDQIADEFFESHAKNPQTVLVGFQQALAHLSFANLLQQEVEAKIANPGDREKGLQQLFQARTLLGQTKQQTLATIRNQANQNLSPDMLTSEQLRTLVTSLEYQLAIVNLTSARLTDASTEAEQLNRLDSLGRVPAQLAAVRGAVANSRALWWKAWIKEATCRRMLGEFQAADDVLKRLRSEKRPTAVDAMFLQEEMALAIAIDDRARMKSLAERALKKRHDAETEVALVQLLVAAGQIEKASALAKKISTSHGLWWARRADIALLSGAGKSTVSNKAVGSAELRMLLEAAEKAEQNGDLEAAARGYLSVAASQFSDGNRAGGLGTTVRAAMAMEKQGKHDEAAAVLLKASKSYASESLSPSIHLRGCWNLSKANSEQFEKEATSHIRQWADSETANQARNWLAAKQVAGKNFDAAFETLVATQPSSPLFSSAVALARYAGRKQLQSREMKGLAIRPDARKLLQRWGDVFQRCDESKQPMVAVAMAELGIFWQAEDAKVSARRMLGVAESPIAESDVEFQILLALLSEAEAKQRIEKANSLPFNVTLVRQLLLRLERLEDSRLLGEVKLAIAENAIPAVEDPKVRYQFRIAKASALTMLGRKPEALKIYQELGEANPKNLKAMVGWARASSGEQALRIWRSIASRTASHSPSWFEAKYNVARLLHESGKSDEAAKMLKYIKAVPPGWEKSDIGDDFERLLRDASR